MAHFAELDNNNKVLRVLVISDNDCNGGIFPHSEQAGINFCKKLFGENTIWRQTSYNSNFRYNFAGIGFQYDEINDAFIGHKPFGSWVLNEEFKWVAPVEYPTDGNTYIWSEQLLNWQLI